MRVAASAAAYPPLYVAMPECFGAGEQPQAAYLRSRSEQLCI